MKNILKRKHFLIYRKKIDAENFFREQLPLYIQWRNEERDLYHGMSTYADAFELQKCIIKDHEKFSHLAFLNMVTAEIKVKT